MIWRKKMKSSHLQMHDNNAVKLLCQKHNIGQTELSRRFEIPLRTVQDWYSGRSRPPIYVIRMLEALIEHGWQAKKHGGENE